MQIQWSSLAAAQSCSFLNAATAVASERLSGLGLDVPAFQCFLNYLLVALVHGGLLLRDGYRAKELKLSVPLQRYVLLGAVDVLANVTIVQAFQFTSITSVTLLDSASVPVAVMLSWLLLNVRYRHKHLVGTAVVAAAYAILVLSDIVCSCCAGDPAAPPRPLLGDLLTVVAASLYACSNVLQEGLLKEVPTREVLAMFGFVGATLSGLIVVAAERKKLAEVEWSAAPVEAMIGFAVALFGMYTLVPVVLSKDGSTYFNLHMLTSDLWSAAARAAFFGGFGGMCATAIFFLSLGLLATGLAVYVTAGTPITIGGLDSARARGVTLGPGAAEEGFQLLQEEQELGGASGASSSSRGGDRDRDGGAKWGGDDDERALGGGAGSSRRRNVAGVGGAGVGPGAGGISSLGITQRRESGSGCGSAAEDLSDDRPLMITGAAPTGGGGGGGGGSGGGSVRAGRGGGSAWGDGDGSSGGGGRSRASSGASSGGGRPISPLPRAAGGGAAVSNAAAVVEMQQLL